jgi:hypothetical protein
MRVRMGRVKAVMMASGLLQLALVIPLGYLSLKAMAESRPVHWAAYWIILPAIIATSGSFVWANRQLKRGRV